MAGVSDDPAGLRSDPPQGTGDESWLKSWWRPAMAWQYFFICVCDFFLFPVFNGVLYAAWGVPYHDWKPLTLQGGGLYHLSMGAIVGVSAWNRTQEKVAAMTVGTSSSITEQRTVVRTDSAAVVPTAAQAPISPRAD